MKKKTIPNNILEYCTKIEKNEHSLVSPTKMIPVNDIINTENILLKNPHCKVFSKKDSALEYINNNKNNNLYLISEDISNFNHKKFYAIDHESLFLLASTKKYCLYECYEIGDKIKLSLDIDVKAKDIPSGSNRKMYFDNLIDRAINLIGLNLEKYKIKDPEIIVLQSCREDKLSAHIIYNNIYFDDVYAIKVFMMSIDSELICKKTIDPLIYKVGCLRMLWCSKYGLSNPLEFYKAYNYQYNDNELGNKKLFFDSLLRNINDKSQLVPIEIPKNVKIVKRNRPNKNKNTDIDTLLQNIEQNNIETPLILIKKYLDILNDRRVNDYHDWVKIGMIIFNCHPNINGFNLWNEWSSKGVDYGGRDLCAYKWNTFKFYPLSIATLKYYAREDNLNLYSEIEYTLEKGHLKQSNLLLIICLNRMKKLKTKNRS